MTETGPGGSPGDSEQLSWRRGDPRPPDRGEWPRPGDRPRSEPYDVWGDEPRTSRVEGPSPDRLAAARGAVEEASGPGPRRERAYGPAAPVGESLYPPLPERRRRASSPEAERVVQAVQELRFAPEGDRETRVIPLDRNMSPDDFAAAYEEVQNTLGVSREPAVTMTRKSHKDRPPEESPRRSPWRAALSPDSIGGHVSEHFRRLRQIGGKLEPYEERLFSVAPLGSEEATEGVDPHVAVMERRYASGPKEGQLMWAEVIVTADQAFVKGRGGLEMGHDLHQHINRTDDRVPPPPGTPRPPMSAPPGEVDMATLALRRPEELRPAADEEPGHGSRPAGSRPDRMAAPVVPGRPPSMPRPEPREARSRWSATPEISRPMPHELGVEQRVSDALEAVERGYREQPLPRQLHNLDAVVTGALELGQLARADMNPATGRWELTPQATEASWQLAARLDSVQEGVTSQVHMFRTNPDGRQDQVPDGAVARQLAAVLDTWHDPGARDAWLSHLEVSLAHRPEEVLWKTNAEGVDVVVSVQEYAHNLRTASEAGADTPPPVRMPDESQPEPGSHEVPSEPELVEARLTPAQRGRLKEFESSFANLTASADSEKQPNAGGRVGELRARTVRPRRRLALQALLDQARQVLVAPEGERPNASAQQFLDKVSLTMRVDELTDQLGAARQAHPDNLRQRLVVLHSLQADAQEALGGGGQSTPDAQALASGIQEAINLNEADLARRLTAAEERTRQRNATRRRAERPQGSVPPAPPSEPEVVAPDSGAAPAQGRGRRRVVWPPAEEAGYLPPAVARRAVDTDDFAVSEPDGALANAAEMDEAAPAEELGRKYAETLSLLEEVSPEQRSIAMSEILTRAVEENFVDLDPSAPFGVAPTDSDPSRRFVAALEETWARLEGEPEASR